MRHPKQKIDPSWHITGNHPTRECKPADLFDESCWLVSLPRGFEALQIAVWGDGLDASDACESASEWLLETHPNAASSSDEDDSTAKLLTSEEKTALLGMAAPQTGFSAITPGPWRVVTPPSSNPDVRTIQTDEGDEVACVTYNKNIHQSLANAHLLAAAPELIATLTDAVEDAGFSLSGPTDHRVAEDGEPKWVCRAREVIAKAYAVPSKPARVAPPLPEPSTAKKSR
jgi:hypothetical protein